jgi:hypothetical protein
VRAGGRLFLTVAVGAITVGVSVAPASGQAPVDETTTTTATTVTDPTATTEPPPPPATTVPDPTTTSARPRTTTTAVARSTPTTSPGPTVPPTNSTVVQEPDLPVEPPTTTVPVAPTGSDDDDGWSVGNTVTAVVAGMLLAALALSIVTFRFWRHTRPVPVAASVPAGVDSDDATAGSVPAGLDSDEDRGPGDTVDPSGDAATTPPSAAGDTPAPIVDPGTVGSHG